MLLDFGVQPLMLGKATIDSLKLTNVDLDQFPYHILTYMGGLKKARGLAKQKIVIQISPNKLVNYNIVQVQVVVTHVTSYDLLVGGVVLYPLGVTIDFWEETTYYYLNWEIGSNQKTSLPVKFIGKVIRKI